MNALIDNADRRHAVETAVAHGQVRAVRRPRPWPGAISAVSRSVAKTAGILVARRLHQPSSHLGDVLEFADGTSGRVYRETRVDRDTVASPVVLVVKFQLRGVKGWGHRLFRWESLLNTPLFVGFPGFVSKLWLAHDANGTYRGFYEWDSEALAEHYAGSLWWVLVLVSRHDSIDWHVTPGRRRDDVLAEPALMSVDAVAEDDPADTRDQAWWRLIDVVNVQPH